MRVNMTLIIAVLAVLAAAAFQGLSPVTRWVPVKWPFLTAVALYYALAKPAPVALTVVVWAGVLTDALGGLPQGCTCVFLALAYAGALGLRKAFGEGSPARGVALTGLAAAAQQVWMRMWVAGTGVPVFSLEMLRLAAVAAGAGLAAGAVAFAAVGALERFVGIGGGVKFSK